MNKTSKKAIHNLKTRERELTSWAQDVPFLGAYENISGSEVRNKRHPIPPQQLTPFHSNPHGSGRQVGPVTQ